MKPIQQVFALVLENLKGFRLKKGESLRKWNNELKALRKDYPDPEQCKKKEDNLRNKEVKALLFDDYLRQTDNMKRGDQSITSFFAAHH